MKLNYFIFSCCLSFIFCFSPSLRGDAARFSEEPWALQEKETGCLIYRRHPQKEWEAFFYMTKEAIVSRSFYLYDSQGSLAQLLFDDGQSEDPNDLAGVKHRHIIDVETHAEGLLKGKPLKMRHGQIDFPSLREELVALYHFVYDEEGSLTCIQNDRGECLENGQGLYQALQEKALQDYAEDFQERSFLARIWEFMENLSSLRLDFSQEVQEEGLDPQASDWLDYLAESTNWFLKGLLGPGVYLMMGADTVETEVDVYGQGEMSDKVRVTFINGMLNYPETILESLQIISEFHGGVNVHYVYRPSQGWVWDLSGAFAVKTGFSLGFRSLHVYLLAALWRKLIDEMGGVGCGGVILHYAHSLGGTETLRARDLLHPEEQKMIRVVTFGSPTLIPNEGFQKVVNIVSSKDGVSYNILIDPFGCARQVSCSKSDVEVHPSLLSRWIWPFDHALAGPTYSAALKSLGQNFLKEFGGF